jgi:hypothetical protein
MSSQRPNANARSFPELSILVLRLLSIPSLFTFTHLCSSHRKELIEKPRFRLKHAQHQAYHDRMMPESAEAEMSGIDDTWQDQLIIVVSKL